MADWYLRRKACTFNGCYLKRLKGKCRLNATIILMVIVRLYVVVVHPLFSLSLLRFQSLLSIKKCYRTVGVSIHAGINELDPIMDG